MKKRNRLACSFCGERSYLGQVLIVLGLATSSAAVGGTLTDAVVAAQVRTLAQISASGPSSPVAPQLPPDPPLGSPPVDPPPAGGSSDVVISQVIDLDGALHDYPIGDYALKEYAFDQSVQIRTGDTVDLTVTFGADALQLSDMGSGRGSALYGWLAHDSFLDPANSSAFTISNAYVDLLGSDGSVLRTIYAGTQSNGSTHIGPDVTGLLNAGETLTIYGYHAYFEVVSLENGAAYYRGPWVYVQADSLNLVPIPEASTYAMMLVGLALVAGAARRRSST